MSSRKRRSTAVPKTAAPQPAEPAQPKISPRLPIVLIAIALVVLIAAVYAPLRHADFVQLDDTGYVSENTHVMAGLTQPSVAWAMTTGYLANWHPLTWLSLMLDVELFGVSPGAIHMTNVALHIVDTLLLFALLVRMTGGVWPSAFVAALFGVHPAHVESVAWISERKDVLSTLFWLLTMWTYVSYVRKPGAMRYAGVVVCLALGLMAKPMLVTLPLVLLLMDWWPLDRLTRATWPRLVREKLPLVAIVIVSSVVTFIVQRQGGAVTGLAVLPWDIRITNALASYAAYIGKMLWPANLVVFYPYPRVVQILPAIVGLLVLALGSLAAWRLSRRHAYVGVGWLWYLVTLIPVIGLIQVGTQAMADRYTYVPLIGLFIVVAWGVPELLARMAARGVVLAAAGVVIVLACAATAGAQVAVWHDNTTLWRHALAVSPDNYRAQSAFGSILGNEGKPTEALAHFLEAIRLEPDFGDAYYNLGRTYADLGRLDEAVTAYRQSMSLRPDFAEAHNNLGIVFSRQGHIDDAIKEYQEALRINPDFAEAHANRAAGLVGHANAADVADARRHAERARELNANLPGAHYSLGLVNMSEGRLDEAMAEYREALRLKPDMADAHVNLGFVLAGQGRVDEAIPHFREAVQLQPNLETARMYLAVALAGTGKVDEADTQFREVLRINPASEGAKRGLDALARMRRGRE